MPYATVASDVYETADVEVHLTPKVAFDNLFTLNDFPDFQPLLMERTPAGQPGAAAERIFRFPEGIADKLK